MKYERIRYPDGQISAKLTDLNPPYQVTERINSYEDLIFIKAIADAMSYMQRPLNHLYIPCLFGQRSDARFSPTQSLDLKIITDIINSCGFKAVTVFDPHSTVGPNLITNCNTESSLPKVEQVLYHLHLKKIDNVTLVSPDAGAYKKVFKYAEYFNLPLVAANKFRDLKGKITLNILGDVKDKDCLIVDDLLDGGHTFHLLAEQLKQQGANKVFLYVSHAYFNKGIDFTPYIDHFYCTNSVKNITHEKVTQFIVL